MERAALPGKEGAAVPFTIICQDITKMQGDAIVNAADTGLQMGGVGRAIFQAARAKELQAACDRLAPVRVGIQGLSAEKAHDSCLFCGFGADNLRNR